MAAGKKIQYVGAVGQITFDKWRKSLGEFEIAKSDGTTAIEVYTAPQIQPVERGS